MMSILGGMMLRVVGKWCMMEAWGVNEDGSGVGTGKKPVGEAVQARVDQIVLSEKDPDRIRSALHYLQ